MSTPVIIDAIVVLILLAFCIWGAKRGLFRSLAGLVIVVVALVGASMLSYTFSTPLTKAVTPLIRDRIVEYVENAVEEQAEEHADELPAEVHDLLERLGLDEEVREDLREKAEETVTTTGTDALNAVVESVVYGFVHTTLFVLFFLALTLLLNTILKAMDLVFRLPGLHFLNTAGGALFGVVEGALLLFFAVWVLRRMGVSFETELFAGSRILHIFTTYTPMSVLAVFH